MKCPACAHTPGPSRRPCLEFSRGFIGTTSINQVRECGDIILYYIMNYEQNGKNQRTERNAINKALYPANEKRKEYNRQIYTHTHTHTRIYATRAPRSSLKNIHFLFLIWLRVSKIHFLLRLMRRGSRGEQWPFVDDEADRKWFRRESEPN